MLFELTCVSSKNSHTTHLMKKKEGRTKPRKQNKRFSRAESLLALSCLTLFQRQGIGSGFNGL